MEFLHNYYPYFAYKEQTQRKVSFKIIYQNVFYIQTLFFDYFINIYTTKYKELIHD